MDHSEWVEIVEQPASRRVFFYLEEDGEHICVYDGPKEIYTKIKVHGYSGFFIVLVSCVSGNEPYKPHPNNLIGSNCKMGVCTVVVPNSNTCAFPSLIIHKARDRDFDSRLKLRKEINVDPYQKGFKYKESDIDSTVVRLCFQVYLPDDQGKITRVVPPVVSKPIYEEKHCDRASRLMKHLYQQVEEQSELCDVIVQVRTWSRKYHWNVLCVIPFFERLYGSRLKERQTGIINLSIGSPYSVQTALDFLYGREPEIEIHTAYSLMETADFLMIDELKDMCVKKVKSFTVSSQSCLTLLVINSKFDIFFPNLEDFYLSHLPELMKQDQMLEIDKEAVRLILTDQTLSYIGSDNRIKFLVRWAAFSPERKSDFRELLSYLEKDDFSDEILRTVHDSHPYLESIIDEAHPGCYSMYGIDQVTTMNSGCDVFVLYPPVQKLSMLIFHVYSLKHMCWFKIPIKSCDFVKSDQAFSDGKDMIITLDKCTDTLSIFNLVSGHSHKKKLIFQEGSYIKEGSYVTTFHFLTVSGKTIYVATNFCNKAFNTNAKEVRDDGLPPDLLKVDTCATVFASTISESHELKMEPLFSIDFQVDTMCVAGDHLCLLSQSSQQLIVYSHKSHIRTAIKLPLCSLATKDGILSSSGSHVYILVSNFIKDIEFETSPPKKILWKAQNIFPNEMFYQSELPLCKLKKDFIVKQVKGKEQKLKWQTFGSTKSAECTNKVYDIDIPTNVPYSDEHMLISLQLPKKGLKCHINCPHCKDKEAKQLDLFSYQQSFSSEVGSAIKQQELLIAFESSI